MGIAVHSGTRWPSFKSSVISFQQSSVCLYRGKLSTEEEECYFTKLKLINDMFLISYENNGEYTVTDVGASLVFWWLAPTPVLDLKANVRL